MSKFIPYGKQSISQDDIDAVLNTLQSDWLTQGPAILNFENALMMRCEANFAYVVCNATAALHLAYLTLGVDKGDWVWTSPNTFLATANAALMCGASVDFVDICPQTYNMSVEALEKKLIQAEKNNTLPKVVVPVHFAGQSCDMQKIHALSRKYHFNIVEDASHAIGGKYLNKPVGSCQYSDIAVFSFHPVKIITTGEGGALLTNNEKLAEKIALLRCHGMTRNEELMTHSSEGSWYYQMLSLGYNYRITDLQCALGLSQMSRIDQFIQKRHQLQKRYDELLSGLHEVTLPHQSKEAYSALHLYPVLVPVEKRKIIFDYLKSKNIGVNVHYIPVHTQPYYKRFGFKWGDFPISENYYSREISLPLFYGLTEEDQDGIVNLLKESLVL